MVDVKDVKDVRVVKLDVFRVCRHLPVDGALSLTHLPVPAIIITAPPLDVHGPDYTYFYARHYSGSTRRAATAPSPS